MYNFGNQFGYGNAGCFKGFNQGCCNCIDSRKILMGDLGVRKGLQDLTCAFREIERGLYTMEDGLGMRNNNCCCPRDYCYINQSFGFNNCGCCRPNYYC